jgi:hypothetical protein
MEPTEIEKMRAMQCARYDYPERWGKYEKCVLFLQELWKDWEYNPAKRLLKEIGEWNEKED